LSTLRSTSTTSTTRASALLSQTGPDLVAATGASTTALRQQLGSCCVAVLASAVSGRKSPWVFGGRTALLRL
jgi:hypothetical protein